MRIRRTTATAVAALALAGFSVAACGDDDDSSGGGGRQGDVADEMIEVLEREGIEVDEDCVRDIADQLSDEDAEAIADAGVEGDPEVSDAGNELGEKLFDCVDLGE